MKNNEISNERKKYLNKVKKNKKKSLEDMLDDLE